MSGKLSVKFSEKERRGAHVILAKRTAIFELKSLLPCMHFFSDFLIHPFFVWFLLRNLKEAVEWVISRCLLYMRKKRWKFKNYICFEIPTNIYLFSFVFAKLCQIENHVPFFFELKSLILELFYIMILVRIAFAFILSH